MTESTINEVVTEVTASVTSSTPVTSLNPVKFAAPKSTIAVVGHAGINVSVEDGFRVIRIDETKHESFVNAKGDVRTFAKVSGLDVGNGLTLNLVLKGRDAEASRKQAEKDIARKIKLVVREKATEKDIEFLLNRGFADETGQLEMGKIESVYADILIKEAREKASKDVAARNRANAEKVASLNGSLQKGATNVQS